MVACIWLGLGSLCFYGRTANGIARWLLGLRPPTLEEQHRIAGPWQRVLWLAGQNPYNYTVWIEDDDDINASAVGSGIVAITRTALHHLPPAQLEAVLAHELGHHNLGHPRFLLAMAYFGRPAALIAKVIKFVASIAVVTPLVFARSTDNYLVVFVVAAVGLCCFGYVLPFLMVAMAAVAGAQALSRSSELAADRYAADLGYGPALQALLQHWGQNGHDAAYVQMNFWEKWTASHPPCYKRFQSLHTYLYSGRRA
ncbi:M48 family metalloprotease [Streptomonospora sediminis]